MQWFSLSLLKIEADELHWFTYLQIYANTQYYHMVLGPQKCWWPTWVFQLAEHELLPLHVFMYFKRQYSSYFLCNVLKRILQCLNYFKASVRWKSSFFSVSGSMFSAAEGKRSSFVNSLGKLGGAGKPTSCFHGFPGHLGRGDSERSGNPLNKEVSGRISGSAGLLVSSLATPVLSSSSAVSALDDERVSFRLKPLSFDSSEDLGFGCLCLFFLLCFLCPHP